MYFMIGIIAFCLVMIAMTARFEKRMVWPYGIPESEPQFRDSSGYGSRCVDDALKAGFCFLGWMPDIKGPLYQISYALLSSPERDCLAIIAVGKIMNMPVASTSFHTSATDGRVFCTTDNQSSVEIDVSRMWRSQLVPGAAFPKLLQRHRELLSDRLVIANIFSAGREAEEFRSIREEHFQAMSRLGLIAFTNLEATHWRYTLYGSLKYAALNYSIGMLRAVTFGRIPRIA